MTDHAKNVLVETDSVAEHLDDDQIRIVEVDEEPSRGWGILTIAPAEFPRSLTRRRHSAVRPRALSASREGTLRRPPLAATLLECTSLERACALCIAGGTVRSRAVWRAP